MSKYRFRNHHKWRGQRITHLMARDGTACTVCGKTLDRKIVDPEHADYISFDHILPRSRGGQTDLRNLRLVHRLCNMLRGNDPITPAEELLVA